MPVQTADTESGNSTEAVGRYWDWQRCSHWVDTGRHFYNSQAAPPPSPPSLTYSHTKKEKEKKKVGTLGWVVCVCVCARVRTYMCGCVPGCTTCKEVMYGWVFGTSIICKLCQQVWIFHPSVIRQSSVCVVLWHVCVCFLSWLGTALSPKHDSIMVVFFGISVLVSWASF